MRSRRVLVPIIFGICIDSAVGRTAVTRKRGYGGFESEPFTCDDAKILNLEDSWHYTWTPKPSTGRSQGGKCRGQQISGEFVPMMINWKTAPTLMAKSGWASLKKEWANTNVQYLLGYNEPDPGHHPHAMTPKLGAEYWPHVQKMAAEFTPPLTLISPAVSSKNVTDDGASLWLDEFLYHCENTVPECDPNSIKFMAFHDYGTDPMLLKRRIEGMAKRYGRKVWLTELAYGDWEASGGPARDLQDKHMSKVLPILDATESLFRYAWFAGRNQPTKLVGESSLLPYDTSSTELTSTGQIYAQKETDSSIVV